MHLSIYFDREPLGRNNEKRFMIMQVGYDSKIDAPSSCKLPRELHNQHFPLVVAVFHPLYNGALLNFPPELVLTKGVIIKPSVNKKNGRKSAFACRTS